MRVSGCTPSTRRAESLTSSSLPADGSRTTNTLSVCCSSKSKRGAGCDAGFGTFPPHISLAGERYGLWEGRWNGDDDEVASISSTVAATMVSHRIGRRRIGRAVTRCHVRPGARWPAATAQGQGPVSR